MTTWIELIIDLIDPDLDGPAQINRDNVCCDIIVVGIMRCIRDSLSLYVKPVKPDGNSKVKRTETCRE